MCPVQLNVESPLDKMILVEAVEDVRFSIMTVELVAAHWPARICCRRCSERRCYALLERIFTPCSGQMSVVIDIKLVENDAFEADRGQAEMHVVTIGCRPRWSLASDCSGSTDFLQFYN